jgi:hypothetical protein
VKHEVDQGTALRSLQEKYETSLTGVVTDDAAQSTDAEIAV